MRIISFFIVLSSFFVVNAQENIRYNATVFDSVGVDWDVKYGHAKTQGGKELDLHMDIFYPANDTVTNRPLILLAHGGFFVFGEKDWFHEVCEYLAESGYVAATIQYRLIDVLGDSVFTPKRAAIDAVYDMKAAVRYFNKDAETTNKYKIDPENIFIGGYSAGAITSLHYAYATTPDDVLLMGGTELLEYVRENGGLSGNSGNPGYSEKVKGVLNIAGSLFYARLVDKGEPILYSVHGTADDIVPYREGLTGETLVITQGSALIHERCKKVGVVNKLKVLWEKDHGGFWYCETCLDEMRSFVYENL